MYSLTGVVLTLSPMGGKVVLAMARYYLKKWWDEGGPYVPPESDPEMVRESLYKLKRNDYIDWKYDRKNNIVRMELTKKGKDFFAHVKISEMSIQVPDNWDGQWRFFMFDVPEKRKALRESLRDRLKSFGFFRFQKSVWVHPFECEKEVRYMCEYLGITPYTTMFTAKIGNDRILRRYFLKQGVLLRRHVSLRDKGIRY